MSSSKRTASRSAKKKATPSKDVAKPKKGDGQRVSFIYNSIDLICYIVQICRTRQGLIDIS